MCENEQTLCEGVPGLESPNRSKTMIVAATCTTVEAVDES